MKKLLMFVMLAAFVTTSMPAQERSRSAKWGLLAVGTHFLWHTFGALAAFAMLWYVYLVEKGYIELDV